VSFLISLGFTCRTGFTLTDGLNEDVVPAAANAESVAPPAPLGVEEPNLGASFGVRGPGERIGTTVDR